MRQRRIRPALLLPAAILLLAAVSLPALALILTDSGKTKDLAAIAQSSVTALAILAGGFFAAYKLEVFRDFAPHLTITHEISHRVISESYVHISVSATLHNRSRVKVDIREGIYRLYQIAPLSDEEVEQLYAQVFVDHDADEIQWPKLYDFRFARAVNETVIEPGESHQEIVDFIVSKDPKSVLVYTYFYNPEYHSLSRNPQGWGLAKAYDIMVDNLANTGDLEEV